MPLLPLWAVRLVQSLSACTRVHFIFTFGHESVELYRYSPMDRTACSEPQRPYSSALPPPPLWTVRPFQDLRARNVEPYPFPPYGPYGLYRASVPVQ
jgi:hypothetical protein